MRQKKPQESGTAQIKIPEKEMDQQDESLGHEQVQCAALQPPPQPAQERSRTQDKHKYTLSDFIAKNLHGGCTRNVELPIGVECCGNHRLFLTITWLIQCRS
jgi:hypothetical protein